MRPTNLFIVGIALLISFSANAQLWTPDLGNGNYKNPVIFADYSDPDIIRAGNDFYMVASSFNCSPGIPVLHSKDLVNWTLINHLYDRLPLEKYNKPAHGDGSWAPSIRFHNGLFYVYFCTPYDGLWVATATDPSEKWTLEHIVQVELWEDPCPLWDDDGNAYLIRSKLCGNALFLHRMSPDGKHLLDNGKEIYRDKTQPTIEGPKFIKKDGYYYIFAPAGGVATGWQTVLRSKNIWGPYEAKVVMHQGNTTINGPHQGGAVELESGEWWFLHFQDRDMYGRIEHLQPMVWKDDGWPIIGIDQNNDGIGEAVAEYRKPNVGKTYPVTIPQTSDEFNEDKLGLQWQWHANYMPEWYLLKEGRLRLNAVKNITQNGNFWFVPNLLMQKFPAPEFSATAKVEFHPELNGEQCGLVVMGERWSYISLFKQNDSLFIRTYEGIFDRCDEAGTQTGLIPVEKSEYYFRIKVNNGGMCQFAYSSDNNIYIDMGKPFKASKGRWIGAKTGLFCINPTMTVSKGFATFDWFRVE
jgi:beta-xylosidase